MWAEVHDSQILESIRRAECSGPPTSLKMSRLKKDSNRPSGLGIPESPLRTGNSKRKILAEDTTSEGIPKLVPSWGISNIYNCLILTGP